MDHIVTQAEWRRTLTDDIGERFTPFVLARGDVYNTSSFVDVDGVTGPADTFTRQMIGVGLDYRYPFVSHGENSSQVIEPRGSDYFARAGGSNKNVPNEDSQSLVFDDTLLFDINKFSGYDRMETGTRTNYRRAIHLSDRITASAFGLLAARAFSLPGRIHTIRRPGLGTDRSDYVFGGYLDYMNRFRL